MSKHGCIRLIREGFPSRDMFNVVMAKGGITVSLGVHPDGSVNLWTHRPGHEVGLQYVARTSGAVAEAIEIACRYAATHRDCIDTTAYKNVTDAIDACASAWETVWKTASADGLLEGASVDAHDIMAFVETHATTRAWRWWARRTIKRGVLRLDRIAERLVVIPTTPRIAVEELCNDLSVERGMARLPARLYAPLHRPTGGDDECLKKKKGTPWTTSLKAAVARVFSRVAPHTPLQQCDVAIPPHSSPPMTVFEQPGGGLVIGYAMSNA